MREVKRAREMMTLIGNSAPPAAPSAQLRKRNSGFGGSGAAAHRLGARVGWSERHVDRRRGSTSPDARPTSPIKCCNCGSNRRNQSIELIRMSEAMAILNGPDTTVTSFGDAQPTPKGKVFANPKRGILLIASNPAGGSQW